MVKSFIVLYGDKYVAMFHSASDAQRYVDRLRLLKYIDGSKYSIYQLISPT